MPRTADERERARRNTRRSRLVTTGLIVVTQLMGLSVRHATAWLHWTNICLLIAGATLFVVTLAWNPCADRAA
jgi:hypothetical protein